MPNRVEREVLRMLGPGVRKCASAHAGDMIRAKQRFAAIVEALGANKREIARRLGVDESTVRAWLSELDLRRHPPEWAIDALGKQAHELAAYAHAAAAGNDSTPPPSGTDG